MPPKKGKAPKKGAKGKKEKDPKEIVEKVCALTEIRRKLEEDAKAHWVVLHMNLMNWAFMDSELRIRSDSSVYELKGKLKAKHGAMVDLKVCIGAFEEDCELRDDGATLEDYGFEGALEGMPEPRYEVYYDFKPADHSDPLLLVWNTAPEIPPKDPPPREAASEVKEAK